MNKLSIKGALTAFIVFSTVAIQQQAQAFSLFSDHTTFQSQLGNFKVDDYENPGYLNGDIISSPDLNVFTNDLMSSVRGETRYKTTTPFGVNGYNMIVSDSDNGNSHGYCGGCNGSFKLDFSKTSVGNQSGVFGAGFDIVGDTDEYAHVTFGDHREFDFSLANSSFFGITSDSGIKSFYIGEAGGLPSTSGYLEIDNLTIGTAYVPDSVPEPGEATGLLFLGVFGTGSALKRFQQQKTLVRVNANNAAPHSSF